MKYKQDDLKELEKILRQYSCFIHANIFKYNVQKKGIHPDDIYQEVRIKIWKLICNEKKIKNYPLYIKKIIKSSVIDHIRKSKRDDGILLLEKQKKISEKKNIYSEKFDLNLKEIIDKAMTSLIENRQKAVKLFLLNLTLDEIATVCNWSRDKTRNLLYRGLKDLKKKLIEMGIEYENK